MSIHGGMAALFRTSPHAAHCRTKCAVMGGRGGVVGEETITSQALTSSVDERTHMRLGLHDFARLSASAPHFREPVEETLRDAQVAVGGGKGCGPAVIFLTVGCSTGRS